MADGEGLAGVHTTAIGAAAVRAVHLLRDGDPKVLDDAFALKLLGWSEDDVLALIPESFSSAGWVTRARVAEDLVAAAYERGARQYVQLGAGLDSFALRRADVFGDLVVFEIDDPPMQEWKRRRIEALDLELPTTLRFVPCDFESESLAAVLADAGFDPTETAIVSWLGVTQYLTRDAIDETLGWVASLPTDSEVLVTYVVPGENAEATKALLARGTRFETFFTPREMAAVLEASGLRAEPITPEQLDQRYFQDRDDGLRASRDEHLMIGRT